MSVVVKNKRVEIQKAKAVLWWYGLPEIARVEIYSRYFVDQEYNKLVPTDDIFIMYVGQQD